MGAVAVSDEVSKQSTSGLVCAVVRTCPGQLGWVTTSVLARVPILGAPETLSRYLDCTFVDAFLIIRILYTHIIHEYIHVPQLTLPRERRYNKNPLVIV